MKRVITGILLAGTIMSLPVKTEAHERQCPVPIEVTYEEAQELMKIASAEALNQGEDGMRLVMSVIVNRVNDPDYPNDIYSVIHQPHQFATAGMAKAEITPEVHMALAALECGGCYPNILGFEIKGSNALDAYFTEDFVYKDHIFYKAKNN